MELFYIVLIFSVLSSVSSKAFTTVAEDEISKPKIANANPKSSPFHRETPHGYEYSITSNDVKLPKYSIYLIGFLMLIMLIAIIVLAVALYLAIKKKSVFGLNGNNKQYVRQESTGVIPLYNANYEEQNKNNGSTLTVNSGIIEISEPRAGDPITPTRLEETKVVFTKKPIGPLPLGPVMPKGQMDAICKEVLRKVQKTDSASYRDLNELLKFEKKDDPFVMKSEDIEESERENKSEDIKKFEKESNSEDKPVSKINSPFFKLKKINLEQTNIKLETEKDNKPETKLETKNEPTNEAKTKPAESADIQIEINTVESDKNEDDSDSETEYDTVPSPIRFRHSGPDPDQAVYDTLPNHYRHSGPERELDDKVQYDTITCRKRLRVSGTDTDNDELDDIPVYDLPPTRDQNGASRNVIQLDPDTQYVVPLSMDKTDSCYVNAKKH